MSLEGVDFVIQEVGTNLRRDRMITVSTVATVAVAIFMLAASVLFLLNLRMWTEQVAGDLKEVLYLKKDTPRSQARALQTKINGWPGVKSARLITKEEGWQKFTQTYPVGRRLEDFPIPFSDAIEVYAVNADVFPKMAKQLDSLEERENLIPSYENISAPKGVTQKIIRLRRGLHYAVFSLAGLMVLAGFVVIHNTTKLSLLARKREIAIMQLVGATPEFVATPFLIEGAIHGLLGAALACWVVVPTHMYLRSLAVSSGWSLIKLLPDDRLITITAALIAAGIVLGVAGAGLSIRRFLKLHLEPETH